MTFSELSDFLRILGQAGQRGCAGVGASLQRRHAKHAALCCFALSPSSQHGLRQKHFLNLDTNVKSSQIIGSLGLKKTAKIICKSNHQPAITVPTSCAPTPWSSPASDIVARSLSHSHPPGVPLDEDVW